MELEHGVMEAAQKLLTKKDLRQAFLGRQLLMNVAPLSATVEMYLDDNEGQPQKLDKFKMLKEVYDRFPRRLLLKCSRKTLKSTLLSNVITLNMVRYSYYKMLYVAPQETSSKYFSNSYVNPRFNSPRLKRILDGFVKNDVFEKELAMTHGQLLLRYCSDDATRMRGPATAHNFFDELQDMSSEVIPIINETQSMSPIKRQTYAGTPLTTDNTINELWKTSNQLEWMMKCTGCNHWNSLTEDNEPMKMIGRIGLSCSKCGKVLNSDDGLWVETNPQSEDDRDLVGYHLAQPILPHYNQTASEWADIYKKVHKRDARPVAVFNEVFGLAYDVGSKPITEEFLKNRVCVLGPMSDILHRRRAFYGIYTLGADWGVNMDTSRTACCLGALRDDGVFEVFFMKIFKDFDYNQQIKEVAERANMVMAFCAADAGPDPNRGIQLANMTGWDRTQLVRYEAGKFKQRREVPAGAIDPSQARWCLHRSDTMTLTFELLKQGKILFPRWEDSSECCRDILNVFIEVVDGGLRQELRYRHAADKPDDFFHALNFAVCQAHVAANNPVLFAPSSTSEPLDSN